MMQLTAQTTRGKVSPGCLAWLLLLLCPVYSAEKAGSRRRQHILNRGLCAQLHCTSHFYPSPNHSKLEKHPHVLYLHCVMSQWHPHGTLLQDWDVPGLAHTVSAPSPCWGFHLSRTRSIRSWTDQYLDLTSKR